MDKWHPIETARKDGRLLLLLISGDEGSEHETEQEAQWRTIGANNFDCDGVDEWKFAGWCWSHDRWTEGRGTPIGWLPLPETPEDCTDG